MCVLSGFSGHSLAKLMNFFHIKIFLCWLSSSFISWKYLPLQSSGAVSVPIAQTSKSGKKDERAK
jgi:hypothetical protein